MPTILSRSSFSTSSYSTSSYSARGRGRRAGGGPVTADPSFRAVATFTLVYGLVALALLALQPLAGATRTADAGGTLEAPLDSWLGIQLVSAE